MTQSRQMKSRFRLSPTTLNLLEQVQSVWEQKVVQFSEEHLEWPGGTQFKVLECPMDVKTRK